MFGVISIRLFEQEGIWHPKTGARRQNGRWGKGKHLAPQERLAAGQKRHTSLYWSSQERQAAEWATEACVRYHQAGGQQRGRSWYPNATRGRLLNI